MSVRKSTKEAVTKTARKSAGGASSGFTEDEMAAMKERAREVKAARSRGGAKDSDGEADLLAKVAEMGEPDRAMATRLHELIRATAPELTSRTWYGMPAYALDGNVLCFFQGAAKFKSRYATLGFSDRAALDDGAMWPTSFALRELDRATERAIEELVRRAVGAAGDGSSVG